MAGTTLSTFPSSKLEALVMLYLQQQDLSKLTPEQIHDLYDETYDRLREHRRQKRDGGKTSTSGWLL